MWGIYQRSIRCDKQLKLYFTTLFHNNVIYFQQYFTLVAIINGISTHFSQFAAYHSVKMNNIIDLNEIFGAKSALFFLSF